MRKFFSHENRFILWNVKGVLEAAGIACQVRNEYVGGAAGDLSPFDVWPEIWIEDADFARAQSLLAEMDKPEEGQQWQCPECHEMNEASFEYCWRCGASREE